MTDTTANQTITEAASEVNPESVRVLLANRIRLTANGIDALRARTPYAVAEYVEITTGIAEGLAVIAELERLWESLFGERPSLLDVGRAATV